MAISFDSLTLVNPSMIDRSDEISTASMLLYSGKVAVSTSPYSNPVFQFTGITTLESDITSLRGKIGTKSTLTIDSTSYTNCIISTFKAKEIAPNGHVWRYWITFRQDTR